MFCSKSCILIILLAWELEVNCYPQKGTTPAAADDTDTPVSTGGKNKQPENMDVQKLIELTQAIQKLSAQQQANNPQAYQTASNAQQVLQQWQQQQQQQGGYPPTFQSQPYQNQQAMDNTQRLQQIQQILTELKQQREHHDSNSSQGGGQNIRFGSFPPSQTNQLLGSLGTLLSALLFTLSSNSQVSPNGLG